MRKDPEQQLHGSPEDSRSGICAGQGQSPAFFACTRCECVAQTLTVLTRQLPHKKCGGGGGWGVSTLRAFSLTCSQSSCRQGRASDAARSNSIKPVSLLSDGKYATSAKGQHQAPRVHALSLERHSTHYKQSTLQVLSGLRGHILAKIPADCWPSRVASAPPPQEIGSLIRIVQKHSSCSQSR